jgi:hypothetical protein
MKAPFAVFSCMTEFTPYVLGHLMRGGFQVARREAAVPAVLDFEVTDGTRRLALIAVKHPQKSDLTMMLVPLKSRWSLAGLFGKKKFCFSVSAWLQNASWDEPKEGEQGAGRVAPLKPPPLLLLEGAAMPLPRSNYAK